MDDEHVRRIRPHLPALALSTPAPDGAVVPPRMQHTHRHLELVERLASATDWAGVALHACVEHLLTSTVTEAARVQVIDAWTEPDREALCIVYRPPHDAGRVVGLRRCRRDALEPGDWRIGDMTTWGYDLTTVPGEDVDAEAFGWNVADFDVGEPLGYVTTILRHDSADVGWWGNLDAGLPRPPAMD